MRDAGAASIAARRREPVARLQPALALGAAGSLICAWLVLTFELASVAVVASWAAVIAIAAVPRSGLLITFALVLLFEQASPDPLMGFGRYLYGGFSSTFGISEAIVSPLEILILFTAASWLLHGVARRRLDFRSGHLGGVMVVFLLTLLAGLGRGLLEGGNLNVALWELRFLFYAVLCYFLATNIVRTSRHVADVLSVALVATAGFALEGAFRRQALINTGDLHVRQELQYGHEDVVFLGAALLLIVAQQLFGAPRWQRVLGIVLFPVIAYTMLAAQRRAGFVALAIAVVALLTIMLLARPRAFFILLPPLGIAAASYLGLFWNESGLLAQPARALRSLFEPDARDAASNFYRWLERFNIRATILDDPLFGVGFGRPFSFVVALPDLSWWPFWHYEPHNNILWVWLKTGVLGFVAFLALMATAIARAANVVRRSRGQARTLGVLTLAAVVMTLVYSYVELGLVNARVTVFVGMLLGTLAAADSAREA